MKTLYLLFTLVVLGKQVRYILVLPWFPRRIKKDVYIKRDINCVCFKEDVYELGFNRGIGCSASKYINWL